MTSGSHSRSTAGVHLVRFGAAIAILVAVALVGVALEQRSLELSRQHSLQTFRIDRLRHEAETLRLRIEELQTPQRLLEATGARPDSQSAARTAEGGRGRR